MALLPVAVPLSAGRCLGTEGCPALGQAGCLPCGLPAQQLLDVVGKETSLRGREVLCVWRGGLTPRPAAIRSILSLATLTTRGRVPLKGCTAGSCCSTLHLMCCRGKLLAESRRNMGKGVALAFAYPTSPLSRYRKPGQKPCLWAGGSGVVGSSCSQPWGQPHACPAGQRGAPASFAQPIWMLQLPPLPSLLLPEGCAMGMAAQGAGPCWGESGTAGGTVAPLPGTTPRQALGPGSEHALAGPWGSLAA